MIVAGFQQKCCFSAPNVDFLWLFILIHVKIGNQTKKQHLLPENNNFVENQQPSDVLLLHTSFILSRSSKNISDALLTFSTHVLNGFLGNLLKKSNDALIERVINI